MTERRIVLLGCSHSAGEVVQELARSGRSLPEQVEWVSIPCGGTLDELHILRAFEAGAEQVIVLACFSGACRSVDGNLWAEKRVLTVRALLEEAGIAGSRLRFHNVAPTMAADLLGWIEDPAELLDEIAEVKEAE